MSAPQWAPDPHRRAELRYWDGASWTNHVSSGGRQWDESQVPPPPLPQSGMAGLPYAPPAIAPTGSNGASQGRLRAAGIMGIVQASLALLVGLWIMSVAQSDAGELLDSISGGTLTFIGVLMLAIGGGVLTAGIGSVRGRPWGRITLIVFESIFLLLLIIGLANGSEGGGAVLSLLYTGTVLGLAASAR